MVPSMARPLLLLDVDGVLCLVGPGCPEPAIETTLAGMPLRYSEELPRRLGRLGEEFDLVWATAWEDAANEVLAPLFGLDALPVIHFDSGGNDGSDVNYKLASIRDYVDERPFAWVDDDIGQGAIAWMTARRAPTLALEVGAHLGLGRAEEQVLLEFAQQLGDDG